MLCNLKQDKNVPKRKIYSSVGRSEQQDKVVQVTRYLIPKFVLTHDLASRSKKEMACSI